MIYLDIAQAKSNLVQLLELAISGQEIVITQDKAPVAKISPMANPVPQKSDRDRIYSANITDETLLDLSKQT